MGAPTYITPDELAHILLYVKYDMNTGRFTPTDLYLRTGGRAIMFGVERNTGRGFIKIQVLGKSYAAHRLAWAIMYGETHSPIYHKDGNGENNCINNLTRRRPNKPLAWQ